LLFHHFDIDGLVEGPPMTDSTRISRIRRSALVIGSFLLLSLAPHQARRLDAQSVISPPATTYLASWSVSVKPNGIAANREDGTLAVIDAGNNSIEILRPGGTHRDFRRGFRDPRSAAFLPGGVLLVGEAGHGSVKGYDEAGRIVLTLGSPHGEFETPNALAVHPVTGRIYVVDSALDKVKVYRSSDGAPVFQFGSSGSGPGQLSFPISIAVSPALGEAFVADSRNRRIAVFDAGPGAFLRNIGDAGGGEGQISFLGGLHVDADHRLYAVESLGGFVQIFDPYGGLVGQIGEHGNGDGFLRSPKGVLIDRFNRLLVTSFLDDKIEVWGLDVFENPVDQDIVVFASAIPAHLNERLPSFQVVFQVQGGDPEEIDPATLRINGVVRPDPDSYRIGPHLSIRFPTSEVLATLPPDFTGDTILELSGATKDGLRFEGEIPVAFVPAPSKPDTRKGAGR
jgi:DNA-binding beta-propeller fold protein YncE